MAPEPMPVQPEPVAKHEEQLKVEPVKPEPVKKLSKEELFAEFRSKELRKLREQQAMDHAPAQFDEKILRERLTYSIPLQRLYERVYFDDYDLFADCLKADLNKENALAESVFKDVIH